MLLFRSANPVLVSHLFRPKSLRAWLTSILISTALALIGGAGLSPIAHAQQAKPDAPPAYNVKENYTKYEYRIPMRDGKKLFTTIYAPKDSARPAPFLMVRTPYSVAPYGVDQYRETLGPSTDFERAGYIFVFQDVRGRFMSEGLFQDVRPFKPNKKGNKDIDESSDAFMCVIPATMGAKVRITGRKRPIISALPPYRANTFSVLSR